MKNFKKLVIGGIQNKIFNLVLISLLLLIIAFCGIMGYQAVHLNTLVGETNEKQLESINAVTSQTMESVVNTSLSSTTRLEAYIANNLFDSVKGDVTMLADYAAKLYADPKAFDRIPVDRPKAENDGKMSVQLMCEAGVDLEDPVIADEIGLLGNMADMMNSLNLATASLNACFIGTPNGIMLIADDYSGTKFLSDGSIMDFPVRQRKWYTGAEKEGGVYFTDVEYDAFTGNIGIVCSIPIYGPDGKLCAVAGADLFLNSMVEEIISNEDPETGFVMVINRFGHVVFAPEGQTLFKVETSDTAVDIRKSANTQFANFIDAALEGATGVEMVETYDGAYYMCGAPLEAVGWAIITVVNKDATDKPALIMKENHDALLTEATEEYGTYFARAKNAIITMIIVIFAFSTANAIWLSKRIASPIDHMANAASAISEDNIEFQNEDIYRTGDEIEVLADALTDLSSRTRSYIHEITRITAEKERIGAELDVARNIQRDMLPGVFPPYPDKTEFDLYATMEPAREVGGDFYDFFLIDDDHLALVMADVSGKGVPAALFMVIVKTLIKNRAVGCYSPAQILSDVNNQLCENSDMGLFVTVWFAIIEISTGVGAAVNAGHEHPAIRRAGGRYELIKYRHTPAIGTFEDIPVTEHTFNLYPGDSLFVYTDGVAEANNINGELFGDERLTEALNINPDAGPEEVLNNMHKVLEEFADGEEQFDDITMLAFKYFGVKSDE